ncbi:MAG: hypothetical protein E7384_08865 [Ruminococcaceae bacterium]|nr:hypothetical protein [Oscillospiraceae bacterium]
MNVNSEKIPGVISLILNGDFNSVDYERYLKEAGQSALKEKFDVKADASDIKSGIYSIIYAGLSSGLESVGNDDAIEVAKEAALSKTKEVIPEYLCDQIKSRVESSVDSVKEASEKLVNDTLTKVVEKLGAKEYTDADEIMDAAKQILAGETTVSDVAKNKAYTALEKRVTESLEERRKRVEGKAYKNNVRKDGAMFVQDSVETVAGNGLINFQELLYGNKDLTEALEDTVTESAKNVSDNALNKMIDKACDKIGITKLLDPRELMNTAENVKNCFAEYLKGDITYKQFFLKIGHDGLYRVAQAWGTKVGVSVVLSHGLKGMAAALTGAASATIVTAVYTKLYEYAYNVFEEEALSEQRLNDIRAFSEEAISVIKEEREFLLNSTVAEAERRHKVFGESLSCMTAALDTNNIDLLISSLNSITTEVGGKVQFNSFEEFDEFMLDDSSVLEL